MHTEFFQNGVSLQQNTEGFHLGTDSVVLADFVEIKKGMSVCDLGSGSGAVALMLLARDNSLRLTGVEIQEPLARLAQSNAERSRLTDAFSVICGDLRNIRDLLPMGSFDCVVSNPPYFPADCPTAKDESTAIARTELLCTVEDLCKAAAWLLPTGGRFYLVHRPERLADLLCALRNHGLEVKKLQFVRHSHKSKRSLVLLQAVRGGKSGLSLMEDLILYREDGTPTEDCRRIYHL